MTGSGLAGIVILLAMFVLPPEQLLLAPLLLWALAGLLWFAAHRAWVAVGAMVLVAALSMVTYLAAPLVFGIPDIAVSQYKGVAYARNFPDARRIYRDFSPFGDLQIYASSYVHFAPGLSDNAAFNIPEIPANTYVGMYIDGEGPEGIMRGLPPEDAAYYRYLPMFYPYVLKRQPKTFIVQFGGGLSTATALNAGARSVTVAENNPEILRAFRDKRLSEVTGNVLADPRVQVVDYDGRLFLAHTDDRYDVIDLSLADSVGLSNPGGFAITEKYAYTVEAIVSYIRALADGGVLSITLWNKEEPPKSILKLYATVAQAVERAGADPTQSLFVSSSYLSTTTVLYKKGCFSPGDVAALRERSQALSFDEIYSPGFVFDAAPTTGMLEQYRASIFGTAATLPDGSGDGETPDPSAGDAPSPDSGVGDGGDAPVPSTTLGRLFWQGLIGGSATDISDQYVFDSRPLTNDRPYFAAYVRPQDVARTLDRLDIFQDDWGYLLLWATLGIACLTAAVLVIVPVIFGWRTVFSGSTGKLATAIYFGCLGLGYIMVEVGLISRLTLALGNPTISATALISGMLVFSGLGSLVAERTVERARIVLPLILAGIAVLLVACGLALAPILEWIGAFPYALRLVLCCMVIAPLAFLMGFPMATAMTGLARLNKDAIFVWAWGANGCFSVIGAAAVPVIAVSFGLAAVFEWSAAAYLLAIPAFLALLMPLRSGSLAR